VSPFLVFKVQIKPSYYLAFRIYITTEQVKKQGLKQKNRNSLEFLQQIKMKIFPLIRREIFSGSEGGAGIPFPFNPFPSRPARAVWDFAKRRRRFAQKRFEHFQL